MDVIERVSNYVVKEHPAQAAATLAKQPVERVGTLLDELTAGQAATLLRAMAPTTAVECVRSMTKKTAALEAMAPAQAGRILRAASRQVADDLLVSVKGAHARAIRAKMSFEDATVGALVERAVLLSPNTTLEEARTMVKTRSAPYVYAVDQQSHLLGVVKAEDLWEEPLNRNVGSIMQKGAVTLDHRTPVQTALRHPAWNDFDVLPVVDHRNECLGVLRHKVLRQSAVGPNERPPIHAALAIALNLAEFYWTSSSALMLGPNLSSDERRPRRK